MLLKNTEYQRLLNQKGYFTIPLLSNEAVKQLLTVYETTPKQSGAFSASAHLKQIEIRKSISRQIKQVIEPSIHELIQEIDVLGASFVVKATGYNEVLQPHQDWNIVDEKKNRSYNIWIPLVDTSKDNGGIMVIPESHKWIDSIRHSSIPCAFNQVHNELFEIMTSLDILAGHALIYDHALLHASHANHTSTNRVAIAVGIKPKNADMRFYFNKGGEIKEYEVNKNYFLEEDIFNEPYKLIKISEIYYDFPLVNLDMLMNFTGIVFKEKEIPTKTPWFKIYTPMNIFREIRSRLKSE